MANGELGASRWNSAFRAKCLQWHRATQGGQAMGKPSRGQSVGVGFDCGGLLEARRRLGLALWHAGLVQRTQGIPSSSTEWAPRRPGVAGSSGRNGERVSQARCSCRSGDGCSGAVVSGEKRWLTRKRWRHGRCWGRNGIYRTSPIGRRGRVGSGSRGLLFCLFFVKPHRIASSNAMELLPEARGLPSWKGQIQVQRRKENPPVLTIPPGVGREWQCCHV
ncbi:hypothetical protein B0T18DRAFT_27744 [Schizothecium vesticola]|uniref:Uncharacterized protein n=1 Tax=Schizothecium vesticola TaxID=314040 RepID=A0AA40FAF5_9PEZI|nr:hypothetical protein B0T18DRAFT_27744 [Schizothecium vesticola]